MSKFMLKYQDTEWDIDNPSLTITHEFVSGGIHAVLEHFENFLRSAGYTVDGKLEIVSVEDDSEEYEVNTDDSMLIAGLDEIKVDWPQGDHRRANWPYGEIKIESINNLDNMNSSSAFKDDEITIKVANPNEEPIHFRV